MKLFLKKKKILLYVRSPENMENLNIWKKKIVFQLRYQKKIEKLQWKIFKNDDYRTLDTQIVTESTLEMSGQKPRGRLVLQYAVQDLFGRIGQGRFRSMYRKSSLIDLMNSRDNKSLDIRNRVHITPRELNGRLTMGKDTVRPYIRPNVTMTGHTNAGRRLHVTRR